MAQYSDNPRKRTWWELVLYQALGMLVVFGFPGAWTAAAPVSWVKFTRSEGRVTARAQTCVFFVIPYKTVTVDPVIGIGDRSVTGSTRTERRSGTDRKVKSEDMGYLAINGPEDSAEVPVTPHNLKSVTQRAEAFLKDPLSTELKFGVVANWKFSVIGGGLVSLLPLIYLGACAFVVFRGLARMLGLFRPKHRS